jgi:hypothetical protein
MRIDANLAERIRRGEYEVDARAVAEAMVRRWRAGSSVLVTGEALDRAAVRPKQRKPEPGSGLS